MLVAHGTLVLVADGAKMTIFRNHGSDIAPALEVVETDGQFSARTSAQGTDRPGRSFSSVGSGRSGYSETDFHQADEDRFAEIVQIIELTRRQTVLGVNSALVKLYFQLGAIISRRVSCR